MILVPVGGLLRRRTVAPRLLWWCVVLALWGMILLPGQRAVAEPEAPPPGTPLAAPAADELTPLTPELTPPAEVPPVARGETELTIDSRQLDYDELKKVYIARGSVRVEARAQGTSLSADEVVYDPERDLVIARGHVVIERGGQPVNGSLARIRLDEQSILLDNPTTRISMVRMRALQSYNREEVTVVRKGVAVLSPDNAWMVLARQRGLLSLTPAMIAGVTNANGKEYAPVPIGNNLNAAAGVGADYVGGVTLEDEGGTTTPTLKTRTGEVVDLSTPPEPTLFEMFRDRLAGESAVGEDRTHWQPTWDAGIEEDADTALSGAIASGRTLGSADEDTGLVANKSGLWAKLGTVNVRQYPHAYVETSTWWPKLYYKRLPLLTFPFVKVGRNAESGRLDLLFPNISSDPNMGGAYFGAPLDFQVGGGTLKVGPFVSFGRAAARENGRRTLDNKGIGFGTGVEGTYRDKNTRIRLGYTTAMEQVVASVHRTIFPRHRSFQFIGTYNDRFQLSPFLLEERPYWSAQLVDRREVDRLIPGIRFFTSLSAGMYEDDWFPNNRPTYFVAPTSNEPRTAGRARASIAVTPVRPLLLVPRLLSLSAFAQVSSSAYTTGDVYTILQGGPTLTVNLFDRLYSHAVYSVSSIRGHTPFVFDTYFLGRNSLTLTNALRLNNYITVGSFSQLNLEKDNARDDVFVGNSIFMIVGSKDLKLNVRFDFIQQNFSFGLNYFPGKDKIPAEFEEIRLSSPPGAPKQKGRATGNGGAPSTPPGAASDDPAMNSPVGPMGWGS